MYTFDELPGITLLLRLYRTATHYFHRLDRQIMDDIEWEHHCVLSGVFLMLFGVCTLCVILVAILFTLDKLDTERAVQAIVHFMKKF